MKVGILTGGGDCPGLNAVIRAVVRKGCFHYEDEFVGFLEGWRGVIEDKTMPLDLSSVGGILPAWRHHPADLAHQPGEESRRAGKVHGHAEAAQDRGPDRHRRR